MPTYELSKIPGVTPDFVDYIKHRPNELRQYTNLDIGRAFNAYNAQMAGAQDFRGLIDARQKVQMHTSYITNKGKPFRNIVSNYKNNIGEYLTNFKNNVYKKYKYTKSNVNNIIELTKKSEKYAKLAKFSQTGKGKAAIFGIGALLGALVVNAFTSKKDEV